MCDIIVITIKIKYKQIVLIWTGQLVVSPRALHGIRGPRGSDGDHVGPKVRSGNATLPVVVHGSNGRRPLAAAEQARPRHETQVRGHTWHGILEVQGTERVSTPSAIRRRTADPGNRRWTGRRRTGRRLQGRSRSRYIYIFRNIMYVRQFQISLRI